MPEHEHAMTLESFKAMLGEITERLGSDNGHIGMTFPYFVDKYAPVTGEKSVLDYEVAFFGDCIDGRTIVHVEVKVPATTLCPCSKDISSYGAHNQRSLVTTRVQANEFVSAKELIDIADIRRVV